MIYRNEKYPEKHFSVVANSHGVYLVREFFNRVVKTELTLSADEYMMFKVKLREGGWNESIRS